MVPEGRMRGRAARRISEPVADIARNQRTSLAIARSRRLTAPTPHPALRATFPRKGGRERPSCSFLDCSSVSGKLARATNWRYKAAFRARSHEGDGHDREEERRSRLPPGP